MEDKDLEARKTLEYYDSLDRVSIFDSDEYNTYCASCFIKKSNLSEIIRIVAGSKTPPEDFDA